MGLGNKNDQNIIAIGREDTKEYSDKKGVKFEETAAFLLNHGAGHNAGLQHAGDFQISDENGQKLYVPFNPNVMTRSLESVNSLKEAISSPANRWPVTYDLRMGVNTISIRQMYQKRFGNNTPIATLPVEKDN